MPRRFGWFASRTARNLALLVLGLWAIYLVGANVFLRTRWGHSLLNRKPDKLTISWDSGWTIVPCLVHLRGLDLHGRSRRADWRTTIDRGRMVIWLPSLFRRNFKLLRANAYGAEVEVDVLPPPETPRPPRKKKRGWRVDLDGLRISPLGLIRINEHQLVGAGSARGRARFEVRGPVVLELEELTFEGAQVKSGEEIAADTVNLSGSLFTEPFVVGDDELGDILAGTSGTLELDARAASLGFVGAYLSKAPWLEVGGSGQLTAELAIADGWLAPHSRLGIEGPTLQAEFFGLAATGAGRVEGKIPEGAAHTEITVALDDFAVARSSDAARLVEGEDLSLVVTNDSTAIDRPAEGVAVSIHLPPARVPDLSALSTYVPQATNLRITGGSAELAADLAYSMLEGTGNGSLSVNGNGVEASFQGVDLRSDIALEAVLTNARLEEGTIDLSGSRLEIDEVQVFEGGALRDSGWWGRAEVPGGRLTGKLGDPQADPTVLDVDLDAQIRDTGPLVALLEQKLPKLAWFDRLLTVKNVQARSRVISKGPELRLNALEVTGGAKERIELLADLTLRDRNPEGVVFARWAKLSAAVALEGAERDWKLVNSRRWYETTAKTYERENPAPSRTATP